MLTEICNDPEYSFLDSFSDLSEARSLHYSRPGNRFASHWLGETRVVFTTPWNYHLKKTRQGVTQL